MQSQNFPARGICRHYAVAFLNNPDAKEGRDFRIVPIFGIKKNMLYRFEIDAPSNIVPMIAEGNKRSSETFATREDAIVDAMRIIGIHAKPTEDFILQSKHDGWAWVTRAYFEITTRPKRRKTSQSGRMKAKNRSLLADALRGILPPVPDFSAETHRNHRSKLAKIASYVRKGDIESLKAFHIRPYQTSLKAISRYREFALIALEARMARVA